MEQEREYQATVEDLSHNQTAEVLLEEKERKAAESGKSSTFESSEKSNEEEEAGFLHYNRHHSRYNLRESSTKKNYNDYF